MISQHYKIVVKTNLGDVESEPFSSHPSEKSIEDFYNRVLELSGSNRNILHAVVELRYGGRHITFNGKTTVG